MVSLVDFAKKNELPSIQFMDPATLDWINSNRPDELKNSIKRYCPRPDLIPQIVKLLPLNEWFFNNEIIDSIHGLRHLLRVAFLGATLDLEIKLSQKNIINIIIAAHLHDIRRIDDKGDPGHGERAAVWFKDNLTKITEYFSLNLESEDIEEIFFMIRYHENPYTEISHKDAYKKYKTVIDIMKTADALDRYRQPKLKWWISDNYLALKPSLSMKKFAYDLVVGSERLKLDGLDNTSSVLDAFKKLLC